MELENVDGFASAKEEQNPKEAIVAEASPTLEPLIDKLDIDNKDSLHLEKILPRRKPYRTFAQTHGSQSSSSTELIQKNA